MKRDAVEFEINLLLALRNDLAAQAHGLSQQIEKLRDQLHAFDLNNSPTQIKRNAQFERRERICAQLDGGESAADLALQYGVGTVRIRQIQKYHQRWLAKQLFRKHGRIAA